MALADVLAAIERDGQDEIANVMAEATNEATKIVEHARDVAREVEAEMSNGRDGEIDVEVRRILASARLDGARLRRAARETVYRRAHESARAELESLRQGASYAQVLRALMLEVLAVIPTPATIRIDGRDEDLARGLLAELGSKATTCSSLQTRGGLEVASPEGHQVRNTLEERIERADAHLRQIVAQAIPGMAYEK